LPGGRDERRDRALGDASDRHPIERDRRGAGAAVGGVDVDGIGEDFEREPRRLGRLVGQHDGARAGVEHHRDVSAVDLRRDRETSAAAARDLDGAPPGGGATRQELGEDALCDVGEFEAIGIPEQ
jgi:hypothetical protein